MNKRAEFNLFSHKDFIHVSRLEDAVDSKLIQTKVVTVTQTLVDGKVVSENKDVKSSEEVVVQKAEKK